ncbi:LapA family protein [Hyphococcus flavus]|uniref:LapA family protein n=1 Tax=Hyphococcus flavus TaxID=1866326 RepID=A0AAE9ZDA8_9PROT|nr:LapA family protein [Hyphococcus flavus]WDI32918.1 LapA family protein [Hyphococcus flavus]
MMKWFYRIIWIPILIVSVLFLFANRALVAISLDPFNVEAPAMATPALPLWFWLMGMLFIGVGLGSFGMWLSGAERRAQARDNRRELKAVKKENAALSAKLDASKKQDGGDTEEPPKLEATSV